MNYLGLNKNDTTKTIKKLNSLLANYHVYYQNLRNFHWNVSGKNFFEMHAQFEALYDDAKLKIDEIAERVLTLRHTPLSKMSDYLKHSEIKESEILDSDAEMVETILENHRILIEIMRDVLENADNATDEGTIDMIGGFLETIEKKSWMLDAWSSAKLAPVKI